MNKSGRRGHRDGDQEVGGKGPGQERPVEGHVAGPAEPRETTATKLQRIARRSARVPDTRFDSLMHLFNEESLAACFHELDGRKAVGVDGVTKAVYGENLDERLQELVERMRRMGYRPGPVRQVLIPKAGRPGATRALGISNLEDKLVQMQMRKVLEAVFEPLFLECSYGFRPGRGAHAAVKALHQHLFRHEVNVVIDVDLASSAISPACSRRGCWPKGSCGRARRGCPRAAPAARCWRTSTRTTCSTSGSKRR
jgi:hypothetical protein